MKAAPAALPAPTRRQPAAIVGAAMLIAVGGYAVSIANWRTSELLNKAGFKALTGGLYDFSLDNDADTDLEPAGAAAVVAFLDSPLGRAGAASVYSAAGVAAGVAAPDSWGPLPPDRPEVDCEELVAAVLAPWDGRPTLGCDSDRPAFPAYYACILDAAARGKTGGGAVVHLTGHYGLGNQLRTAVVSFLVALASRRPFVTRNKFLLGMFSPPQLPRLVGQSTSEREALERAHFSTVCNGTAGGRAPCRASVAWPEIEPCTGRKPPPAVGCIDLAADDLAAQLPSKDVRIDLTYDDSPGLLRHPRVGLVMRRLFCTASPIRVQAAVFRWLLSRPHPELALAAAALARKLGFPYPGPRSTLHGLSPNETAALIAVRGAPQSRAWVPGGFRGAAAVDVRCGGPRGAPVVGVQVRSLFADVNSTGACALQGLALLSERLRRVREAAAAAATIVSGGSGATVAAAVAAAAETGGGHSVSALGAATAAVGPRLREGATGGSGVHPPPLSSSLSDIDTSHPLCIWLTTDSNATWGALRGPLSMWGPVLLHDDAQPSHTMETAVKPDLPVVLGLPRTPFLDGLKMDAVDFYLLGEVDHMVKGDSSSFGEYGFLRSGLQRGASFIRYNTPLRSPYKFGAGCFSKDAADAGFARWERVESHWGEVGLAVPRAAPTPPPIAAASASAGAADPWQWDWGMDGLTACRDR